MIKLNKDKFFDLYNEPKADCILVRMDHKTATPRAMITIETRKQGRQVTKRMNAAIKKITGENYPRYIAVNRDVCWFNEVTK